VNGNRHAILIAHDPIFRVFGDRHVARLAAIGTLLNTAPLTDWNDPQAHELLSRCTVICGFWGCPPIDDTTLRAAPELGLIAYAGGTVKGIVGGGVWRRGIRVTSCAPANAEPVAQFTLASIVFAGKQIPWRINAPDPFAFAAARTIDSNVGNYGSTVGIVGASLIGRRVIQLLALFDEMSVVVYDPFLSDAEAAALGVRKVGLTELCAVSDIVSLHAPSVPETRHMIGGAEIAAMRDGCTLINTARGALVDHDALLSHLRSGRLFAMLDVTDPEPLPVHHELRTLPNVMLTPHAAGSEGRELARLADRAIDEIERWVAGQPALYEVTQEQLTRMA